MLCPIGQSNEKPPLQALAKWWEYVTAYPLKRMSPAKRAYRVGSPKIRQVIRIREKSPRVTVSMKILLFVCNRETADVANDTGNEMTGFPLTILTQFLFPSKMKYCFHFHKK